MNKIEQIIDTELYSRFHCGNLELATITYLVQHGTEKLKQVTKNDIAKIKETKIATAEFNQALVRSAVRIAKECDEFEILAFVRKELWMTPNMVEYTFYSDDYELEDWDALCGTYDVDVNCKYFTIKGFVEDFERS